MASWGDVLNSHGELMAFLLMDNQYDKVLLKGAFFHVKIFGGICIWIIFDYYYNLPYKLI